MNTESVHVSWYLAHAVVTAAVQNVRCFISEGDSVYIILVCVHLQQQKALTEFISPAAPPGECQHSMLGVRGSETDYHWQHQSPGR